MAKITDNTDLSSHGNLNPETNGLNWISQINAGGTVYDIATHHSITFKDGANGSSSVWNGLTDLEVVIPTVQDLIQNPIVFAGTVSASGVTYNDAHKDGPKEGYLVFVTEGCTLEGIVCEPGDMAVYANGKWNIVTGEQQVKIAGDPTADKTFTIGSGEQSVLEVEGKTLSLKLTDLDVTYSENDSKTVNVDTYTLENKYIKLQETKGDAVGEANTFNNATALADGKVTFTNGTGLITDIDFGGFDAGSFPQSVMSAKNIPVSGGVLTPSKGQDSGDFVDSVSINKTGFFVEAGSDDTNKITMVDSITLVSGDKKFYTGITTATSTDANLTIEGVVAPADGMNTKFIKGFDNGATTVLTAFTPCEFKFANGGNTIATGFGTETSTKEDGKSYVVSDVTVTANNDTDVLNSASVVGHVLTFGSTKVASSVTTSHMYKPLNTTSYSFTPASAVSTNIQTGGFTQATTSYYKFTTENETVVSSTSKMWKIGDSALNMKWGSYTIDHSSMYANVPVDTFVTEMSGGVLPSWRAGSVTSSVNLEGSVSTTLASTSMTINGLKSADVAMGVYTLVSADSTDTAAVAVAAPQQLDITASVDLTDYVTDVTYKAL